MRSWLLVLLAALASPAPASAAQLPRVSLQTAGPIPDAPPVTARVRVGRDYSGGGRVEVRGQSSQMFPKKSYALELNRKRGLLGMPADDDWVLYAGYNDKTLMRNVVAYAAARGMGRWAAATRFVELRLNGRYQGVYVLMERNEISRNRLRGDYLLEFTFPYQAQRKGPHFVTPLWRRPIVYEDPERHQMPARRARAIRLHVSRVERGLKRGGWRRWLDEPAAVDYVLLQELFRNVDAFHGSSYLLKRHGRPLELGPLWDLDLAMGNSTASTSARTRGWWTRGKDWAEALWKDKQFRRALRARWRQLRAEGFRADLLRRVDAAAAELRPGPAGRNFRRWPVLNRRVWRNPAARGSWTAEVRYLRGWLHRRIAWLDKAL